MKTFRNITIITLTVALTTVLSGSVNEILPADDDNVSLTEQNIENASEETPTSSNSDNSSASKTVAESTTLPKDQPAPELPAEPAAEPVEKPTPEPTPESAVVPPVTAPAPVQKKPAPAPAPVAPRPVVPAPAPAPPVAPAPPAPAPQPAPEPAVTDQAWVDAAMAKYGVYAPAGTAFIFGPMPESCAGADGCTVYSYRADGIPFNIQITLKPGLHSEYLLFHEIGHAKGIRDECEADNFSRSVVGPVQGHYC